MASRYATSTVAGSAPACARTSARVAKHWHRTDFLAHGDDGLLHGLTRLVDCPTAQESLGEAAEGEAGAQHESRRPPPGGAVAHGARARSAVSRPGQRDTSKQETKGDEEIEAVLGRQLDHRLRMRGGAGVT